MSRPSPPAALGPPRRGPRLLRLLGFTLIELLVVMAIVATLLSIAAPRYFDRLDRAREAALRQSLSVVRDAIDKYRADTGTYPPELADLVRKRYLRTMPKDPITESDQTWQIVPPPEGEGEGVADIRSGAPGNALNGENYGDW